MGFFYFRVYYFCMKKIMIIYSRYGGGHKAPAEALEEGFKKWEKDAKVEMVDFGDLIGNFVDYFSRKSFFFSISRAPVLHRIMAALTNSDSILNYCTRFSKPFLYRRFAKKLKEINPDLVVTTFPAANRMLSEFKKDFDFKLITVVTDLLSVHRYWIAPGTDYYLVALPEMTNAIKAHGVSEKCIKPTGFPIRPGFFEKNNKSVLAKKHKLSTRKFTALYLIGSAQDYFAHELVKKLDSEKGIQGIVICGHNKNLYKKLKKKTKNTLVLGYVKNINDYMHFADVLIGKAGTNFIMESAAASKPIIITNYIEPQEYGNVEVVLGREWGFFEPGTNLIIKRLKAIKKMSKTSLKKIQKRASEVAPKNSTKKAVQTILEI